MLGDLEGQRKYEGGRLERNSSGSGHIRAHVSFTQTCPDGAPPISGINERFQLTFIKCAEGLIAASDKTIDFLNVACRTTASRGVTIGSRTALNRRTGVCTSLSTNDIITSTQNTATADIARTDLGTFGKVV